METIVYTDDAIINGVEKEEKECKGCGRCGKKCCKAEQVESREEKKYEPTLGVMNGIYVRPYTSIGHYNEAREGKAKDDEMER